MTDRLRLLLARPLDPSLARAVLILAIAVTGALTFLVAAGLLGVSAEPPGGSPRMATNRTERRPATAQVVAAPVPSRSRKHLQQDPQDRSGTPAGRRARRQLRRHRALQHVPFRRGQVTIQLIGAEGATAILTVRGPNRGVDRRAYRAFLNRYRDNGRAYRVRFVDAGGSR